MPRSRCSACTRRPIDADQFAGAGELLEFVDFAAPGGDQEAQIRTSSWGGQGRSRHAVVRAWSNIRAPKAGAPTLARMIVLGIESSCDETGVALVEAGAGGVPRCCAHALHSQIDMHQAYGGVVPELASRDHIRRVLPLAQAGAARGRRGAGGRRRGRLHARARAWPARCWSAPAWPARWARRWASRCSACTTSKAICCRRFLSADPPRVPLRRAAGVGRPHAADAGRRRRALRAAGRDHRRRRRRGLRQARQADGPAAIRAGRRWRGWPSRATPRPSSCRGRCCTAATSISRSPA